MLGRWHASGYFHGALHPGVLVRRRRALDEEPFVWLPGPLTAADASDIAHASTKTRAFAAPEILGSGKATRKADAWSFAVCILAWAHINTLGPSFALDADPTSSWLPRAVQDVLGDAARKRKWPDPTDIIKSVCIGPWAPFADDVAAALNQSPKARKSVADLAESLATRPLQEPAVPAAIQGVGVLGRDADDEYCVAPTPASFREVESTGTSVSGSIRWSDEDDEETEEAAGLPPLPESESRRSLRAVVERRKALLASGIAEDWEGQMLHLSTDGGGRSLSSESEGSNPDRNQPGMRLSTSSLHRKNSSSGQVVHRRKLLMNNVADASRVFADAFQYDPRFQWLVSSGCARQILETAFAPCALKYAITAKCMGSTWGLHVGDEMQACCVWLPPHRVKRFPVSTSVKFLWQIRSTLKMDDLQMGVRFLKSVQREYDLVFHDEPNWCLYFCAVAINYQCRGFGQALLEPVLAWADMDALPCGLYTFTARSLAFFQRLGFRIAKEVPSLNGMPAYWIMRRAPVRVNRDTPVVDADAFTGEVESRRDSGGRLVLNAKYIIKVSEIDCDEAHPLGEGSFGVVYRGTWRSIPVAIKVVRSGSLHRDAAESLIQEALQLQDVRSHPNVVSLYGVCKEPLQVLFQYCSGGSLASRLRGSRACILTRLEVHDVIIGIARGVHHLHCEGLIHRDLAARNILLEDGPRLTALVADFGLSKVFDVQAQGDAAAEMHTVSKRGPVRHMAPEWIAEGVVSKACDVYAFAMTMYEVLTRLPPWAHLSNNAEVAREVVEGSRPPIPSNALIVPGFEDGILLTLMKDAWRQKQGERPTMADICKQLTGAWPDDATQSTMSFNSLGGSANAGPTLLARTHLASSEIPTGEYIEPDLEDVRRMESEGNVGTYGDIGGGA
jgi:serine/threonine protein kinase